MINIPSPAFFLQLLSKLNTRECEAPWAGRDVEKMGEKGNSGGMGEMSEETGV